MAYPLMFEPGTKIEYSSFSFTVAAAAAEAVTGRSFQQLSADSFTNHAIRGFVPLFSNSGIGVALAGNAEG